MLRLRYFGEEESHLVDVDVRNDHIVQITGDMPVKRTGFYLSRLQREDNWDYTAYKTVYRETDGGVQFSNDGSVYVPPVPAVTFSAGTGGSIEGEKKQSVTDYGSLVIPTPVPDENYTFSGWVPEIKTAGAVEKNTHFTAVFQYVPTLEEVQEQKIAEINAAQQTVIRAGVNVTLTDGTVEHFTLTDHDQTSLMGLQSQVMAGEQMIPWHTSDEAEHCKFYSNADMALITTAALAYVTWHVTYFRDLRIYIRSLADKEAVGAVVYGMDIPEAYQSEPLKAMIAAQNQKGE